MGSAKEKLLATVAVIAGCAIPFVFHSFFKDEQRSSRFVGFVLGAVLAQINLIGYRSGKNPGATKVPPRGVALVSLSVILLAVAAEICLFFVFRASLPRWADLGNLFTWALSTSLIWAGVFVWLRRTSGPTEAN